MYTYMTNCAIDFILKYEYMDIYTYMDLNMKTGNGKVGRIEN